MDGRIDSLTDQRTDGLTNWWIDRLTDWLTDGLKDWRTDRLTDSRTHEFTDSRTHGLMDSRTHGLAYVRTDRLIDSLFHLLKPSGLEFKLKSSAWSYCLSDFENNLFEGLFLGNLLCFKYGNNLWRSDSRLARLIVRLTILCETWYQHVQIKLPVSSKRKLLSTLHDIPVNNKCLILEIGGADLASHCWPLAKRGRLYLLKIHRIVGFGMQVLSVYQNN